MLYFGIIYLKPITNYEIKPHRKNSNAKMALITKMFNFQKEKINSLNSLFYFHILDINQWILD